MESRQLSDQGAGSEKNVESVARNLITLIQQSLDAGSSQTGAPANLLPRAATALNLPPSTPGFFSPPTRTATSLQNSVSSEMQRSFPGIFRGKRRFSKAPCTVTRKWQCFQIYVLPSPATVTPKGEEQLRLCQAGLGMRMVSFPEDAVHNEINEILNQEYPKLQSIKGSWMFYKASGGSGQRQLAVISPQVEGYTTPQLKRASNNGKNVLYVAPLQGELDVTPLSKNASEFSKMPKATCENCQETMPLHLLALHVDSCKDNQDCEGEDSDVECVSSNDETDPIGKSTSNDDMNKCPTAAVPSMVACPICSQLYPTHTVEIHASFCGMSIPKDQDNAVTPRHPNTAASTSASTSGEASEWMTVADPKRAVQLFTQQLLNNKQGFEENRFTVDLRKDQEEQDMSYVRFYKRNNVEWGSPLTCRLEGDAAVGLGVNRHVMSTLMLKLRRGFHLNLGNGAITKVFEGQPDHLVPANSAVMVESELFLMAGRMIGHCFLYGGPGFPGLSPSITHVLLGGSLDTATVMIEDCPDLDIRETITLLAENCELTDEERGKVVSLCMAWDLPFPTSSNVKWLHDKLLLHAVLGRSARQVKQLRKGLKETGIWPLLSNRADVVKLLFPCEREAEITPQMILGHIKWPTTNPDSDDDEDDISAEAVTRVTAFFRTFVERASSEQLKNLLRFWVGWEVPPEELIVKVASGHLPRALTCFETIKLPDHHTHYKDFESNLMCAIATNETGFGLV